MLRYQYPPTKLFLDLIDYALDLAIGEMKDTSMYTGKNDEYYFTTLYTKLMGGNTVIYNAMKKIYKAYKEEELYDLSDYYWWVLDAVVYAFCEEYNKTDNLSVFKLVNDCSVDEIDCEELVNSHFLGCLEDITCDGASEEETKKIITEAKKDRKIEKLNETSKTEEDDLVDISWAHAACGECFREDCDFRYI